MMDMVPCLVLPVCGRGKEGYVVLGQEAAGIVYQVQVLALERANLIAGAIPAFMTSPCPTYKQEPPQAEEALAFCPGPDASGRL
jgi:hypothetical protein